MSKELDPNHPRADLDSRMKKIAVQNNPDCANWSGGKSSSSSDGQKTVVKGDAGLKSENEKLKAEIFDMRKKLEQSEVAKKEYQTALIHSQKSCEKHKQNLEHANARITGLTGDLDRSTSENTDLRNEITGLKGDLDRSIAVNVDLRNEISGLKGDLDHSTVENVDLRKEITGLTDDLDRSTTENADLRNEVADLAGDLDRATAENTDLRKKIENLNAMILAKPKERNAVADLGAGNIIGLKKPANVPADKSRIPAAPVKPVAKQDLAIPPPTKAVSKNVAQKHKLIEKPGMHAGLGPNKAVFNRGGPKNANAAVANNVQENQAEDS